MAIWNDTVDSVLQCIRGSSIYNANRSNVPVNLDLIVLNQAKDWLCMVKPWRDLRTDAQIPLDVERKCTLPADFGSMIMVYTDPSNIGKPMYWYTLNDNDVSRRYTEEVTTDSSTGAFTRKIAFPPTVFIPSTPHIVYSKVVPDYTTNDSGKICIFPKNIMTVVAKKMFQDYYGVSANQDPQWINMRVAEELKLLESYAYNNNVALDMAVKDRFGNPVFIPGASFDGSNPRLNRPSPFLPSTLWSGGTI
jgi:hypothetical protein